VLRANVAGVSLEACNGRHAHEYEVFDDVKVPEGKYLIPGVVDPTVNRIEHPELVARRLEAYARRVGAQNVMAGTDCGFATWGRQPVGGTLGRVGQVRVDGRGGSTCHRPLSRERLAAI